MPVKDNDAPASNEDDEVYLAPSKVMHEDDPIWVSRYPTRFNRINIMRLTLVGAVLTFVLIMISILVLLGNQNRIAQERNDRITQTDAKVRQLACFIVASFPDRAANHLVGEIRDKYHCPPFTGTIAPTPSR